MEKVGSPQRATADEVETAKVQSASTIYLDNNINIESYLWWAKRSRAAEKDFPAESVYTQVLDVVLRKIQPKPSPDAGLPDGEGPATAENGDNSYGVTESEWEQAQRAARTATWGSMFYLITTDILGPWSVPWSLAQMGWGPGLALFTVFGGLAYYSALQLWTLYIGLDSTRYPLRNYGDLAFRIFGPWARALVNILQSFQFFLNVVLLIIGSGQALAQMVNNGNNGFICFVVAELVCTLAGFVFGQIRTLQRLSFLAHIAVALNVVILFMTMAVVHLYPPNYDAVLNSYGIVKGPIKTSASWPQGDSLIVGVNGLMNGVTAYGGATIFNELMSEMRRPWDFWKALTCAQILIFCTYIVMGVVVYHAQGQFSYNPAYQGIPAAAYRFQVVGNALALIAGMICALLFSNIAIKVFYSAICRDIFKMPPLDSKTGKWFWVALVPIYWSLAFLVAAAVPQISYLASFLGAVCIVQFSYTFPAILTVFYNCQKDAIMEEEDYQPQNGDVHRMDAGLKRLARGFRQKLAPNIFNTVYALGALVTAGLGIYASVTAMHEAYRTTTIQSFSCKNPAG